MDSTVVIEPAYNALSDVRALFEAYTAMLVTHDPAFQIYLDIQHYADELRARRQVRPAGRTAVPGPGGRAGGGCIALRRLDGERCEMKRLYVQPQYRGRGLPQLIRRITEDARQIGYRCMLLDTLPVLEDAVRSTGSWDFTRSLLQRQSCGVHTVFQLDL
ncbi:MAG: GNAT family N-acetyltransferase [Dysosmobacter welbionis]